MVNQILNERWGKLPAAILSTALLTGVPNAQAKIAPTPTPITQPQTQNYVTNAKNLIKKHEGVKNKVYYLRGVPHIGIGYNLQNPSSAHILKNIGVNLNDVLQGKELTNDQVQSLFNVSFNGATNAVHSLVPNFNSHPDRVKVILLDMAFNLGVSRLQKFRRFLNAVINRDYDTASNEMVNSNWYTQVGNRGKALVDIMNGKQLYECIQKLRVAMLKKGIKKEPMIKKKSIANIVKGYKSKTELEQGSKTRAEQGITYASI